MTLTMYHFKMKKNLLLKYYEIQCQLFIDGLIDYNHFEYLENQYNFRKELFTVCLN